MHFKWDDFCFSVDKGPLSLAEALHKDSHSLGPSVDYLFEICWINVSFQTSRVVLLLLQFLCYWLFWWRVWVCSSSSGTGLFWGILPPIHHFILVSLMHTKFPFRRKSNSDFPESLDENNLGKAEAKWRRREEQPGNTGENGGYDTHSEASSCTRPRNQVGLTQSMEGGTDNWSPSETSGVVECERHIVASTWRHGVVLRQSGSFLHHSCTSFVHSNTALLPRQLCPQSPLMLLSAINKTNNEHNKPGTRAVVPERQFFNFFSR